MVKLKSSIEFMKISLLIIYSISVCPSFIFSQHLEVEGQIKISEMVSDSSADQMIVKLLDGSLGAREISTISEFQQLSLSNDTIYLSNGGFAVLQSTPCNHAIGDTFAGGLIFYLEGSGCHGLTAKSTDESGYFQWFPPGNEHVWSWADGLFGGAQNTKKIIHMLGAGNDPAADVCVGLTEGGYTDWYLPSINELDLMYINLYLEGIGNFTQDGDYWSSTEGNGNTAWVLDFSNGRRNRVSVEFNRLVRAIRAF